MTNKSKTIAMSKKFQLWMDDECTKQLEQLIRREKDLPSRSEMLRRLVERAYRKIAT